MTAGFQKKTLAILVGMIVGTVPAWAADATSTTTTTPGSNDGAAKASTTPAGSTLPDIKVHGARERADGPVNGYVANVGSGATKTGTPIHETPQSISVIGRDQLDDRNVTTLNDALHYTAGVATYYSNDTRNDAMNIRGFSSDFFYLDGSRLPAVPGRALDQWRVDPYTLERIEVVKGPSSVLYGLGEPGGVISMVSKMPTDYTRGQVDLLAGSYNHYGIGIDTSGPVDADKRLLYRFIAQQTYSQNQVDSVHGNRTLVAPSVTLRPTNDTSLTLMATYLHDNTMDSNNFLPYYGTVAPTIFGQHIPTSLATSNPGYENYDKTQYSFSYLFEHHFDPNWTFKQNFRYSHLDLNNQALFGYALSADQQTIQRAAMNLKSSYNDIDVDNQLQGKVKTGPVDHTVLAGFNFTNQNYMDNEGYTYTGYALNLYNPTALNAPVIAPSFNDTQMRQVQRQFGLYVQDQMKFNKLILVLSGREDWVSSTTLNNFDGSYVAQHNSAFSGRAGLMYLFDSGIAPYVSYSTAFTPVIGNDAYGNPFTPLRSKQVEVGVKYQPTFMNATFSAALFDLRENNALTTAPDPALSGSVQTGQIRSRGLELEASAELTENLKLLAAYTFQNVVITKGSALDPTVGLNPTATPRNYGSLWLDYSLKTGPLRGLGFGAGVQYVGSTYATSDNSLSVGSFTVADASVHYDIPHWRFVLSANNLFDRTYVARCGNTTRCQYGERRNVLATARYTW
ncbi:iron complex outermembrane receptor protein [Paraburkholderia bannensis]|uniref:Iron complex outermembrane receptor protein n=1 Tax=Paraburkholderia bannensis TaxID=765414 RepID=A0A7W9WQA8_9BURK|nr:MULTISPECIES: TonB-dependent siderophore receptor [Paraburkholderia]MBB3256956.1 iron complex outermembrane receptor protein [Paraburkholderia sp. WP4_3_2]MBB6101910.1 iron complex outermembrane receptor protein [Paraburkholderia bannensis]